MLVKFETVEYYGGFVYINPHEVTCIHKSTSLDGDGFVAIVLASKEIPVKGTLDEVVFKLCGAMGPTKLDDVVNLADLRNDNAQLHERNRQLEHDVATLKRESEKK